MSTKIASAVLVGLVLAAAAGAQVHYHEDGRPWKNRARKGPDAVVPGWYYNLGVTGLRVELVAEMPESLVVRHVFERSPAHRRVKVGDVIVGIGDRQFATPHVNGYGMDKFGPEGPIREFADAIEAALGEEGDGKLQLRVMQAGREKSVTVPLGTAGGVYSPTYPADCAKSEAVLETLQAYLLEEQRSDGSWGRLPNDMFAPLALLASGKPEHLAAVARNARNHAKTTKAKDASSLINWRYMAAAVVLSEYHLATGEKWVLPELQEIYDFISWSQYTDLAQVKEKVRETHPRAWPKGPLDAHGGWGHNPGFEGYGPIAMITGQGALAFALMHHCGIEVDRTRHDAAYAFLARGTGDHGYVWYEDKVASPTKWADMGRTGAAGVANLLSPWPGDVYARRAHAHATVIGDHPESFPDTHGSPIMGMGFAALAARSDSASFRKLLDANRWWFVLAECHDGTFYYQPNRDNAGYGNDSRLTASAVTALIFSIPAGNLAVTGRPLAK